MKHIDWTECTLIEIVPGKMSGQPVLRGTRLRPRDLLINREEGIDWLARAHGIEPEMIRKLFAIYDTHSQSTKPISSMPQKTENSQATEK
jgi:uncharacterized protein (DUF433 family)